MLLFFLYNYNNKYYSPKLVHVSSLFSSCRCCFLDLVGCFLCGSYLKIMRYWCTATWSIYEYYIIRFMASVFELTGALVCNAEWCLTNSLVCKETFSPLHFQEVLVLVMLIKPPSRRAILYTHSQWCTNLTRLKPSIINTNTCRSFLTLTNGFNANYRQNYSLFFSVLIFKFQYW